MKSLDLIHRIRRGDNVITVRPRRIARQSSPNRQAIGAYSNGEFRKTEKVLSDAC